MTLSFLKFKKERLPQLGALRPLIYKSEAYWFYALGLCLAILLIAGFIGGKIFYSQYFESYKKAGSNEDYGSIIRLKALKQAIEKRSEFMNRDLVAPSDPSL